MAEITKQEVLCKLSKLAETNGFELSDKSEVIVNAKLRMFNEEWWRCPCDGENKERFCCSQLCQSDVRSQGQCHCGLFRNKENGTKD